MTSLLYAARTLALSLTLTVTGALGAAGTGAASAVAGNHVSTPVSTPVSNPVGGAQLARGGVIVNLRPGGPPPPAMPGASFVLADLDTGKILVARAPHAAHLPASTLKTLTALTLIPLLNPSSKLMVKPADVAVDGTRLGIMPGTAYRIGTLLQGLLMVSGNDAAYALARANHSVAVTLAAMNATAAHLHALDTVAKDPSGLDRAGQKTSAYDLALIGRAAMKLPDFRRYVRTERGVMPGGKSADGKKKPGFVISNHNKLLFNYQGAIGIKTGYTVAAKSTFIEAATRGGKTYLLTEMASPSGSWRPGAAMLDWAFAHGRSVTPIGSLVEPGVPATPKPAALARSPKTNSLGETAHDPSLPTWVGLAGGISVLALLGAWARYNASGKRRPSHLKGTRKHP